uniref:Uncharacterized protein n=1 Tax=Solanum lycopersicum TaxID=4081 RepID=A0A3Q7GS38_SOLLC
MPNVKSPHLLTIRRRFLLQLRFLYHNICHFQPAKHINHSIMDSQSSPHGSIIFSTVGRTNYGFDIFSIKSPFSFLNSPVEHRLTDGTSINYNGQFVDEDQTLVFVSERSGAPRIYLRHPSSQLISNPNKFSPARPLFTLPI